MERCVGQEFRIDILLLGVVEHVLERSKASSEQQHLMRNVQRSRELCEDYTTCR